jgi:hypothetical protein
MNLSEKDIELTPGKLYILSRGIPWPALRYDGVQYYPMTLRTGSIMFYIDIFFDNLYLFEFLYMDRLIYLNKNVAKTNYLTKLT